MIQKLGLNKIAVVYANTAYGMGLDQQFEQRAAQLGVKPLSSQQINRGDKDFTSTLQAIQPQAPQAIFYAGSLPEAIIIVQQMKEMGLKAIFVGGDTLFQPEFIVQTGTAAEGDYVSSFFPDMLTRKARRPRIGSANTATPSRETPEVTHRAAMSRRWRSSRL